MLKRLHLKNFTVFADADFEFGPGLNVLVGTNGTGKSHVLKVGYAVLFNSVERLRLLRSTSAYSENPEADSKSLSSNRDFLYLEDKLSRVFRPVPNRLSELIRRNAKPQKAIIQFELDKDPTLSGNVILEPTESEGSSFENLSPLLLLQLDEILDDPVIIPAKEILTLAWMRPVFNQVKIPVDDTYLDLLNQLSGLPLQKLGPAAKAAFIQVTDVIGGEVEVENDRYFLAFPKEQRLEMNMVAEGLRKFGILQKLLSNGSLTPQATLFWDEPESNLNPALLRELAKILTALVRQGFQIILATHSMSLLKEFHILSRQKNAKPLPVKYFGLNAGPGEATRIVTTDNFEYLPDVVALEVELEQADALDEIFAKEDRERHANL